MSPHPPSHSRVVVGVCVAVIVSLAAPAAAQESEPAVMDPFHGRAPAPGQVDITGTVRQLEPVVRQLEPVVRDLQTEERQGERTTVTISTDVLFAFDSAKLTPEARDVVSELAGRIAATDSDVAVVGHTDGIGTRRYNQRLSERRAEAVAGVLRDQLDDSRTITTEGRNFSEPIAEETSNGEDDPEGRARNRRVEISFDEAS
jgi:outer membrane protein OmpA-like peptidoglycan-associated protein